MGRLLEPRVSQEWDRKRRRCRHRRRALGRVAMQRTPSCSPGVGRAIRWPLGSSLQGAGTGGFACAGWAGPRLVGTSLLHLRGPYAVSGTAWLAQAATPRPRQ